METFIIRCHVTNTPYMRSFVWLCLITWTMYFYFYNNSLFNVTYSMQCVIYISKKSQYLKNEERYGKTIDY